MRDDPQVDVLMLRSFHYLLPAWLAVTVSSLLLSEAMATPPLPAWQDNASVYLKSDRPAETGATESTTSGGAKPDQLPNAAVCPARYEIPLTTTDDPIQPVVELPPDAQRDHRRLAPPSDKVLARTESGNSPHLLSGVDVPLDSMYAMLTALALVVGLFLLCAWALRRGTRSSSKVLPGEVVSVLGRVPLAARQFAQLLRVGNKLVLVSVTPSGAETLAEVTDPAEVDRLLGICQQLDPKSTTREFEEVFRQLARQPASDALIDRNSPANRDVYEAYRRDTVRG